MKRLRATFISACVLVMLAVAVGFSGICGVVFVYATENADNHPGITVIDDADGTIVFDEATGTVTVDGAVNAHDIQVAFGGMWSRKCKHAILKDVVLKETVGGTHDDDQWSSIFEGQPIEDVVTETGVSFQKNAQGKAIADYMFYLCKSLTALDISKWDFANCTSMVGFTWGTSSLRIFDGLSNSTTLNVTDYGQFLRASALKTVTFNLSTASTTSAYRMFTSMPNLEELTLGSNATFARCQGFQNAFESLPKLTKLNLGGFSTASVTNTTNAAGFSNSSPSEITLTSAFVAAPSSVELSFPQGEYTAYAGNVALATYTFPTTNIRTCFAEHPNITSFKPSSGALTFNYNGNGGVWGSATTKSVQVIKGGYLLAPENPTREGYTFAAWNTKPNGTSADDITLPMLAPAAGTTYYARWQGNTISNTFNANGHGSFADGATSMNVDATYGGKLTLPESSALTPASGYVFVGWFTAASGGTEVTTATDCPLNATTYYAHWDVELTFTSGTGAFADGATSKVVQNTPGSSIVTPNPAPTKTGYTFSGYSGLPSVCPAAPATYVASYTANTVSNVFNANGHGTFAGGESELTVDSTYGQKLTLPASSALTPASGYVFVGWFTAASGGTEVTGSTDCPLTATTYYAHFDVELTFAAGSGTFADDKTQIVVQNTPGASISLPSESPSRTGYTFTGYSNLPSVCPDAPTTYTASYSANSIEHTFNANGHGHFGEDAQKTSENVASVADGTLQGPSDLVSDEGWDFVGWFTAASGGDEVVPGETQAPVVATTYYAHWEGKEIANTFDANGHGHFGSSASATTTSVTSTVGEKLQGPSDLVADEGWNFVGWFTQASGGDEVTPGTTDAPTAATTYYAHWEGKEIANTFNANGHGHFGSSASTTTTTVTSTVGEKLQGPSDLASDEGWDFVGWFTQASGGDEVTPGTTDAPTAATTYYAHWEGKEITNTFDANGHGHFGDSVSATTSTVTSTVGEKLQGPSDLVADEGWNFVGWFTAASGGDEVTPGTTDAPTATTTYYAHWEGITVTNTFDAGKCGHFSDGKTTLAVDATYGQKLVLPASDAFTVNAGYVFLGWFTQATGGTEVTTNTDCPLENTTYYAHFDVNITFDAGSGTFSTGKTVVVQNTPGTALELPSEEPTLAGCTFEGYKGAPITCPDAPATYVAEYEGNTITNTFDANGHGSFGGSSTTTVDSTYGKTIKLPSASALSTDTGYVFSGWFTQASGGTEVTEDTQCEAQDTTYYAHYNVLLTFDAGEGTFASGKTVEVENVPGTAVVLPDTTPTRTGYTFASYSNVPAVCPEAPATYTATYTANTVTNTFVAGSGGYFTGGADTVAVDSVYDSKLAVPSADALRENTDYIFSGWYTESGEAVTDATMCPLEATTYYAHYNVRLTFSAGEGTFVSGQTVQVENVPGEAIVVPSEIPTRAGYTFGSYTDLPSLCPDAPATYVASYTGNTVANTFTANGHGSFSGASTLTVDSTYGDGLTLPSKNALTPDRGYVFLGWFTESEGGEEVSADTPCPLEASTYYAHYQDDVKITLTFDAGVGTIDGNKTLVLDDLYAGETVREIATPVREGYSFMGWQESASGVAVTFPLTVPATNTTYVATYAKVPEPAPEPEAGDGWRETSEGWQYFVDGLALESGWQWIEDEYGAHWYYFQTSTEMLEDHWLWDETSQAWYWVCSSGPMIRGLWQWIDNAWYSFGWDGKMQSGWIWDANYSAWFYCYTNGVMAKNTWVDGYWVDNSGAWVR